MLVENFPLMKSKRTLWVRKINLEQKSASSISAYCVWWLNKEFVPYQNMSNFSLNNQEQGGVPRWLLVSWEPSFVPGEACSLLKKGTHESVLFLGQLVCHCWQKHLRWLPVVNTCQTPSWRVNGSLSRGLALVRMPVCLVESRGSLIKHQLQLIYSLSHPLSFNF